ncbi:hypothetical protein P0G10_20435, partial [Eubacteriales bacterium DFI.9.88]|nr:hypothetical protein [Eubacteriales bacterium DFI.9.88]
VIDSYSEFPVFIGASGIIRSAKIDLKKEPEGTILPIRHRLIPKKLYDHYDPFTQCLSMVGFGKAAPSNPPAAFVRLASGHGRAKGDQWAQKTPVLLI